jgi:hypothetical protein
MKNLKQFFRRKGRICPISNEEIPRGQANCATWEAHGPRLCVVCAEKLADAALRCNECGSRQNTWRRILSESTLKWVIAVFLIIGNLAAAGSYFADRQSHTQIKMTRADENYIYLKAWNTGKKPSALTEFKLCFPPAVGVDSTELEPAIGDPDQKEHVSSVVPPAGSIEVALRVAGDFCPSRKRGSTERYTKEEIVNGLKTRRSMPMMVRLAVRIEESGSTWEWTSHPRLETKEDTFAEERLRTFIETALPKGDDPAALNCRWCIGGCPDLASGLCSDHP